MKIFFAGYHRNDQENAECWFCTPFSGQLGRVVMVGDTTDLNLLQINSDLNLLQISLEL
jgi:hypothetical protein